jgi:hypothetical protein
MNKVRGGATTEIEIVRAKVSWSHAVVIGFGRRMRSPRSGMIRIAGIGMSHGWGVSIGRSINNIRGEVTSASMSLGRSASVDQRITNIHSMSCWDVSVNRPMNKARGRTASRGGTMRARMGLTHDMSVGRRMSQAWGWTTRIGSMAMRRR